MGNCFSRPQRRRGSYFYEGRPSRNSESHTCTTKQRTSTHESFPLASTPQKDGGSTKSHHSESTTNKEKGSGHESPPLQKVGGSTYSQTDQTTNKEEVSAHESSPSASTVQKESGSSPDHSNITCASKEPESMKIKQGDERINIQPTTSKAGKSTASNIANVSKEVESTRMEQGVSCHETKVYCSKPSKPKVTKITSDSIEIEWSKPLQGIQIVTSYTVFYRSVSDPPEKWKQHTVNVKSEQQLIRMTLSQLTEKTAFFFKVRSEFGDNLGTESDISGPIITGEPEKPLAIDITSEITSERVKVELAKPEQGAQSVRSYTVYYRSSNDPEDHWERQEVNGTEERLTVSGLTVDNDYHFKIHSECEDGSQSVSDISEPIKTLKLDVKNVTERAWEARLKWYWIGLQLGMKANGLDVIKENNNEKADKCFLEMITTWLNQTGGSWRKLIDALNCKSVDYCELAKSIAAKIGLTVAYEYPDVSSDENGKYFH